MGTVRKGIILAGGRGSRLYPVTQMINKHLLPVYDKPLVYYPLTTLMLAGIRDILVISSPDGLPALSSLLRDGSQWGISISYAAQKNPGGIAEAVLIGADFIGNEPFALILGDNLFYGHQLSNILLQATEEAQNGAVIFTFQVADPRAYGVLECAVDGRPLKILEKPDSPKSDKAVTGLYFYEAEAVALARGLKPSARGELEITDLNRLYLEQGRLVALQFGRGFVWFDAGTNHTLMHANLFVEIMQTRQRTGIAFPEEVAYRMGFINLDSYGRIVAHMPLCAYRDYLDRLLEDFHEATR